MRALALTRLAAIPAPHLLAAALCAGLALALGVRLTSPAVGAAAVVLASLALATERWRAALLATALLAAGCWWGSVRLEAIDESPMSRAIGSSVFLRAQVTGPTRRSPFTLRTPVTVRQFDGADIDEPAQLELPASERAPPQGAILELVARVRRAG